LSRRPGSAETCLPSGNPLDILGLCTIATVERFCEPLNASWMRAEHSAWKNTSHRTHRFAFYRIGEGVGGTTSNRPGMVGERRILEAGVASRGPASAQAVEGAGTIEAEPCMFFCYQPAAVASSSKQSEPCEADACKVGSAVRKGNLLTKLRSSRALCGVFSKQLQGPV
jgi:hypothetical protein